MVEKEFDLSKKINKRYKCIYCKMFIHITQWNSFLKMTNFSKELQLVILLLAKLVSSLRRFHR